MATVSRAIYATLGLIAVIVCGCSGTTASKGGNGQGTGAKLTEQQQIESFCAKCHQLPNPQYFSQPNWPGEVKRGFRFYEESSDKGEIVPPDVEATTQYFTRSAPVELPLSEPIPFVEESSPRFRVSTRLIAPPTSDAGVSFLSWKKWTKKGRERLVFTDMRLGVVSSWDTSESNYVPLAFVPHPSHVEWCDLDHDGLTDAFVSDLGSFEPGDHKRGSVRWLKQQPDGQLTTGAILSGLGRVSETRVADFNGDGKLDILIAEFGWHRTGSITLMEQTSNSSAPDFKRSVVDSRHGTIRVPPLDLDGDGDIDFVALIAQEYESVDAFINRGKGQFDRQHLIEPADPAFGYSGMQPADLDHDGDIDFVVTNGDMFDSFTIKPYHQIRWLENQGQLKFVEHSLIAMPGVSGAAVGDLDLDGDLDIVAASFFPEDVFEKLPEDRQKSSPSAVWLEQTAPGKFTPHAIEVGNPFHACHLLADVDDDGDLDFIVGMFASPQRSGVPFVIFENQTRTKSE